MKTMTLKLRLQNLLDENTVIEQGGVEVLTQNLGLAAKVDFAYRFQGCRGIFARSSGSTGGFRCVLNVFVAPASRSSA